ncbi:hypothetical protein A2U01_0111264, partial [Trifolium medium]|nr:hypothetical protein [Trifolium medium]
RSVYRYTTPLRFNRGLNGATPDAVTLLVGKISDAVCGKL